ncbi:DNA repair protein RadC, partial [bacterium]|nr:DNA repair protein RadC [bacterium]
LLAESGSLAALATWDTHDFGRVHGLGPAKAAELAAAMELARRIRERAHDPGEKLDAPAKVWARLEPFAAGLAVEKCWVLCLNRRNRLLALHEVSSGTATSSLLHPREVFREAIAERAAAIVLVHNHPSGDPSPSADDRAITTQLVQAGRVLDIPVADHVVIGRGRYLSFAEAGLL